MKKILLSLLILASLYAQPQEKHSIKDLKPNDVIGMRISVPAENTNLSSVWDFGNGSKVDMDFNVLSVKGDSIHLGVKPTRLFSLINNSDNTCAYFDSDYYAYYDNKPWFFLFEDNSVIASVNMNDGGVKIKYKDKTGGIDFDEEEKSTGRSRNDWYNQAFNIPKGLKLMEYVDEPIATLYIDFEKIVKSSLGAFTKEWEEKPKEDTSIPWMIDLRSSIKNQPNAPMFIQITSASFELPYNISIRYQAPRDMPEDRVLLTVGNRKISPTKKENDTYSFSFFLPSPKRAYIGDLIMDLTPNDSLIVSYDAVKKEYTFQGEGAANSAFTNKTIQLYNTAVEMNTRNESPLGHLEAYLDHLKYMEERFDSTLDQYAREMNDYWIKSARLSFDYWYINSRIKPFGEILSIGSFELIAAQNQLKDNPKMLKELNEVYSGIQIPWMNEHFTNVFPFGDYLYQPYTYNGFVKDFFAYKAKETNSSIMTAMNSLQDHVSGYYFAKTVFSGYPRSYLNSEVIKDLMTHFHLEKYNREYEDFLKNMHDPEIRESVVNLHQQLIKIEPGANIKDLNLDVEKYIPLKDKADGYFILLVGDSIGYNYVINSQKRDIQSIYSDMDKGIIKEELKDKVKLCFITNEHYKETLNNVPDIQEKVIFVPDKMIRDYKDKVVTKKRFFLILRNDGVM